MSGFASSIILSGKVFTPPEVQPVEQEAAGTVGKALGVIAAIVIPFAAPAVFGAIASSGVLGASLAGAAASGGFIGAVTNIVGSAVIGGAMNVIAGGSFAQGALSGGLGAGMGALSRGLSGGANAAGAAKAGLNAVGGTGPVSLAPGVGGAAGSYGITNAAAGATAGLTTATQSGGIMGQIGNIFGNLPIDRIGTAIVNAVVNGESQERLDALVAQQQAALAGLNAQEQAAYAQRMQAAEQVLAAAGRMDPTRVAYMRMADVAGVMNREHDQALRNIAVRQGGSLDSGQRKAYERSGKLEIGRRKVEAFGRGYLEGEDARSRLYATGAGLVPQTNYQGWQLGYGLAADAAQARNRLDRSTAAGFTSVFNERDYDRSTSPSPTDPRNQNNNDDDDAFTGGRNWPNG